MSQRRLRLSLFCSLLLLGGACHEDGWQLVHQDLPGALISVWGTSARDVWAVGGDPGDGSGPLVLRWEGSAWRRLATGQSGDLWWVFGLPGGPVFLGGKDGMILRYQGGVFDRLPTPGSATVFGIWGASPDDLWAVGGDGQSSGFAWRFDGSSWQDASGLSDRLKAASIFKVWGRGAQDVWMVGSDGVTAHFDGSALTEVSSGTTRTLFTVHGDAKRTVAVGGFGTGVLLEHDGSKWSDVTPPGAEQMVGVRLTEREGWAVGVNGGVLHRDSAGGWTKEETGLDVFRDLHAVWVDPEGGVWAVGGNVLAFPLTHGVLLHRGQALSSSIVPSQ